jgi:hypothetical protein
MCSYLLEFRGEHSLSNAIVLRIACNQVPPIAWGLDTFRLQAISELPHIPVGHLVEHKGGIWTQGKYTHTHTHTHAHTHIYCRSTKVYSGAGYIHIHTYFTLTLLIRLDVAS